jgi:enterochelin esterase family protein
VTQIDIGLFERLVAAARAKSPELRQLLEAALPSLAAGRAEDPLSPFSRTPGTSYFPPPSMNLSAAVWHDQAVFSVRSGRQPAITIDGGPATPMNRVAESDIWFHLAQLAQGTTHTYSFLLDGKPVGTASVAGYTDGSYPIPGARRGELSARQSIVSRIYDGATTAWWIYANPGIDSVRGAPLMIGMDGQHCVGLADLLHQRVQIVTDNLVHQNRIPPMVHLFAAPGTGGKPLPPRYPGGTQDNAVRGLQYDQVSDRFGRFVHGELLPQVEKLIKLRQDAYSRGAAGQSSGAIAAFHLAWYFEQSFSRVLSTIGSYTGLHWKPEEGLEGGYVVAPRLRRDRKRNMRIWLSTGMYDLQVDAESERPDVHIAGSWPLANIDMANSLKLRGYDFHFRYGTATHSPAQGGVDLPESLTWLWRGYDPERTSEAYEQEEAERARPIFRVAIANRDAI